MAIAMKTGTSPTTVRRVLRGGNKEVWRGTAERDAHIRATAREVGYIANASASAVRKGRFDSVLLVLGRDPGRSNLPERLFLSICATLEEHGRRLAVARCSDSELTDRRRFPSFLSSRFCDGVIVNYTHGYPRRMEAVLSSCGMPFVWINAPVKSNCVRYDDFGAGAEAFRRLSAAGHRRIAWVDLRHGPGEDVHYSACARRDGFDKAAAEAGCPVPRIFELGHLPGAGQVAALSEALRGKDRPTGLAVYDRADRVLYAAAVAGLSVPRDVSVISFGESRLEVCGVPLSLLAVPSAEAGKRAVEALLCKISGRPNLDAVPIPFAFEDGATLAPPPEAATNGSSKKERTTR